MGRRFRPTASVSAREVENELVLLDLDQGSFYVARGVGPRIWELLGEGRDVEDVSRIVADRYGVEQSVALADVQRFAEALQQKGLLEEREGEVDA